MLNQLQMRFFFYKNVRQQKGWVFKSLFGKGAGYKGGSTIFLAWCSGSRKWHLQFRGERAYRQRFGSWHIGPLEFGWTRNANSVPW